jgi:hypothetical protein
MVSEEIAVAIGGKALGLSAPLFGPVGIALHEASKAIERRYRDDD